MILVTGGTGSVGSEVVKRLSQQGHSVRCLVRNPAKAEALRLPGVELVPGDFGDRGSLEAALAGITRAFLLAPPVPDIDQVEAQFIAAAKATSRPLIVNLSAVGAGVNVPHRFGRWHGQTEVNLAASGLEWTILRPNFFLQNLLSYVGMVKGGTLFAPAGAGKAPFVDVRDIAAVAASCLTEPGHAGKTYEVTGPTAIGYADIAAAFTRVLGRPVTYQDIPLAAARESMIAAGLPEWLGDALNELNEQMSLNRFAAVSDAVQTVGHTTPITVEQFIRDHQAAFA